MPPVRHHPTTTLSSSYKDPRSQTRPALTSHSLHRRRLAGSTRLSAKTARRSNPDLRQVLENRSNRKHLASKPTKGLPSEVKSAPHSRMPGCRAQTRPVLPREVSTRKSKSSLQAARRQLQRRDSRLCQYCGRRPVLTCRRPNPHRIAVLQPSAKTSKPEILSA